VTDKNRTKRRSRKHKEFTIPEQAQKVSYPAYLGDCGEYVLITVDKRGQKRGQKGS